MLVINKVMLCFLLLLCIAYTSPAHAETCGWKNTELESITNEYTVIGNKIYIRSDQLHITDEGIFILINGKQVFVQQLNFDENGIYCLTEHLDKITDKCYNGHKIWCKQCFGCIVRYCKFRCICVTWE